MSKIINITHIDADGIGCYMVLKECFNKEDLEPYFINYPFNDKQIATLSRKINSETRLLVMSDLSLKTGDREWLDKLFALLPANCHSVYVDHHDSTDIELVKEYFKDIAFDSSNTMAGSGLTYQTFSKYFKSMTDEKRLMIEEFNKIADHYDLWKLDSYWEKGQELTDLIELFSIYDVTNWTYKMLSNPNSDFVLRQLLKNMNNKKKYRLDQLLQDRLKKTFEINGKQYSISHFFATEYRNYLSHNLPDEVTLCANINSNSISFRCKTEDIHVNKFCEQFGGGGHLMAAGCRLDRNYFLNPDKIIDDVINFYGGKIIQ